MIKNRECFNSNLSVGFSTDSMNARTQASYYCPLA